MVIMIQYTLSVCRLYTFDHLLLLAPADAIDISELIAAHLRAAASGVLDVNELLRLDLDWLGKHPRHEILEGFK